MLQIKSLYDKEFEDLLFAERVCKHVKSNAIVIAKNNKTIGIGAGQTSRVASCKIAVDNFRIYINKRCDW